MHEIRWFAFVSALILAPMAVAAVGGIISVLSAWVGGGYNPLTIIGFTAVMAALWGAPTYLTFGAVTFWYALRRWGIESSFVVAGFAANLLSAPVVAAYFWLADPTAVAGGTAFTIGFGCIFAPLLGGLFGTIYRAFVTKGDTLREGAHGPH